MRGARSRGRARVLGTRGEVGTPVGTPGMRGAPSVSLGLDAEPPEREPKEEDDGHGHHAEHERGACATAHGAPRLPHEPRARENTVEASAMISSGVDVTGPNTGCELYLAVPPRVSAPHHTLPRARTAARRLASAARDVEPHRAGAGQRGGRARRLRALARFQGSSRRPSTSRAPSHPRDSSPSTDPSLTPSTASISRRPPPGTCSLPCTSSSCW